MFRIEAGSLSYSAALFLISNIRKRVFGNEFKPSLGWIVVKLAHAVMSQSSNFQVISCAFLFELIFVEVSLRMEGSGIASIISVEFLFLIARHSRWVC